MNLNINKSSIKICIRSINFTVDNTRDNFVILFWFCFINAEKHMNKNTNEDKKNTKTIFEQGEDNLYIETNWFCWPIALAGDGWNGGAYDPTGFGCCCCVPNGMPLVFIGCLAGELPMAIRIVSFRSSKALFAGDAVAMFGGGGRPGGPTLRGSAAPESSVKNGLGSAAACERN